MKFFSENFKKWKIFEKCSKINKKYTTENHNGTKNSTKRTYRKNSLQKKIIFSNLFFLKIKYTGTPIIFKTGSKRTKIFFILLFNLIKINTVQIYFAEKKWTQTIFSNSIVKNSTIKYSTIKYSTVQNSTVKNITVLYSTIQYSTAINSTVQLYITLFMRSWPSLRIFFNLKKIIILTEEKRSDKKKNIELLQKSQVWARSG